MSGCFDFKEFVSIDENNVVHYKIRVAAAAVETCGGPSEPGDLTIRKGEDPSQTLGTFLSQGICRATANAAQKGIADFCRTFSIYDPAITLIQKKTRYYQGRDFMCEIMFEGKLSSFINNGTWMGLQESESDAGTPTISRLSARTIKISFQLKSNRPATDKCQQLELLKESSKDRWLEIKVSGPRVITSNGVISEDNKTAQIKIPISKILGCGSSTTFDTDMELNNALD